MTSEMAVIGR